MKKDWRQLRSEKDESIRRSQHRNTEYKDLKLEVKFLAGVIKCKKVLVDSVDNFNSHCLVSDKHKVIYDQIIENYLKDNIVIDYEAFMTLPVIAPSDKTSYKVIWKRINTVKVNESSALVAKDKIEKLYKARLTHLGIKDIVSNLKKIRENESGLSLIEDIEEDVDVLRDSLKSYSIDINVSDPVNSFPEFKKNLLLHKNNPNAISGIPTGISSIDQYMKGLRDGELGCIAGYPGSGKTIALMEIALNCWRYYGDVALFTIEMSREQYYERMYSNMSLIKYEKFRDYNLSKREILRIQTIIKKMKDNNENTLHVVDMPNCNIASVKNRIYSLVNTFDIKLVCIDYLNIIRNKKGHMDFSWENQLELATELKLEVARHLNLPVWTASQLTESGSSEAYSKHVTDQLDVGLKIKVDKKVPDQRTIEFTKERNFKSQPIIIDTYFEAMRFVRPPPCDLKRIKLIEGKGRRIKT